MNKANLSAKDMELLTAMRKRVFLTLDFMDNINFLEDASPLLRETTETTFQSGNLRGMRFIVRDIDALVAGMTTDQREGLEALLQSRISVSRTDELAELKKRAANAIMRGHVASEKERQHLEDYAELLRNGSDDTTELSVLEDFLRRH